MAEMFEVGELLRVAVEDERTGAAFYSTLAETVSDPTLGKTFRDLAAEELGHQARFEAMLKAAGEHQAPEGYAGEYTAYLGALTVNRAFPDEQAAQRQAHRCADDREAIELALRIERDTLVLLNEMRKLVSDKARSAVEDIIAEEQSHLVKLTGAMETLAG